MTKDQKLMRGLPMVGSADPEILEKEKAQLTALDKKGFFQRFKGYAARSGPGWLQSAMTLGGGSAIASLYLGAHYQYKLLWVQPLAMAMGVIMMAAASHQTLSTQIRPFDAMKRFIHPSMAWAWALATLLASIVFHFPQYALAAGVVEDMANTMCGWEARKGDLILIGFGILVVSAWISWNYGSGLKGIRIYERMLKILVWMVILAFAFVVIRASFAGRVDWGALFKGFLPLYMPTDSLGVTKVMGAFGAAVGINMTFLFGYTLLARGWGREHRGLARFDLLTGMLIPYSVAVSLIVIAAGCTIYGTDFAATDIRPENAGVLIGATGVGPVVGRVIFGFGILGMTLSTITLQMLVTGFVICEMFKIEPMGWKYKLACLAPSPAFLGVVLWKSIGAWVFLPAFAFGLIMLPIAYTGWFILNNSAKFLKEDRPQGRTMLWCNLAMVAALLITFASAIYCIMRSGASFKNLLDKIF